MSIKERKPRLPIGKGYKQFSGEEQEALKSENVKKKFDDAFRKFVYENKITPQQLVGELSPVIYGEDHVSKLMIQAKNETNDKRYVNLAILCALRWQYGFDLNEICDQMRPKK